MTNPMPPPPDPSRTGWYQDPGQPDGFRWWNGYEWTVQRTDPSGNDGWRQRLRIGAMIAVAIVVVAAIADSPGSTGSDDPVAIPGAESFQSRCQPVPGTVVDSIEEGLTTNGPGILRNAQAVNSGDFEGVWFIAADIQAEGIEDAGDIGVWAVTGTLESPDLTFAIDAVANEFSDWPDGGQSDALFSVTDDGVGEAKECAQ